MPKYRKKPVEILAVRWEGSRDEVIPIADELEIPRARVRHVFPVDNSEELTDSYLAINTLEGKMLASPGDYIIRGVEGEIYSCRGDIFHKTYDEI